MSILIGADICPRESYFDLFLNSNIDELLGKELREILQKSDFNIFNLECPLTDKRSPLKKNGVNFMAPVACAQGLKSMGVNLVTLANNHIKDQGIQGVISTINVLKAVGIDHVGAGSNLEEAWQPYYYSFKGKKIGIYACAEHEFSIAKDKSAGANPFDPLESLDHIRETKGKCDYLIVLFHGGKEHYRYPSPMLQKVCKKMVEKGANLVVCQHSHCIGCKEEYQIGTIIYGQGNFISTSRYKHECWETSLLIEITDNLELRYIPLRKYSYGIRLSDGEESTRILNGFHERSKLIMDDGTVMRLYNELVQEAFPDYIFNITGGNNILFRAANRLTKNRIKEKKVRKLVEKHGCEMYNYIQCETHREILTEGLIKKVEDNSK